MPNNGQTINKGLSCGVKRAWSPVETSLGSPSFINQMSGKENVKRYISQMSRNKIIFCHEPITHLQYVDVGKELSSAITGIEDPSAFSSAYKRLFEQTFHDKVIGAYLAISNWSMLFEPDLKLDLRSIVESFSINKCLILLSNGLIKESRYLLMDDNRFALNLQGLSFIEI